MSQNSQSQSSNPSRRADIPSMLKGGLMGMLLGMVIVYFALIKDFSGISDASLADPQQALASSSQNAADPKPLYWVAPMDPNYRRDKPGKSPMGMDLVPVYPNSNSSVITIAPHVVNNMGVKTAQAKVGKLSTAVRTVGVVQYDEDRLIHIHPRVSGWIEKLYVTAVGNTVKKGAPLYTLYSPQLVNAQEELLLALQRDNTRFIQAATDRLMALQLPDNFIDELIKLKKVKQSVTFFAPQDGVVAGLKIRDGYYVEPGKTLMSIGQLDQVWVEAEVFESASALIKAGLPVSMTLGYMPGKVWQGNVDYVYPSLNAVNRTLRVRLRFDNPDQILKPNMYANIDIAVASVTPQVLIPKQAVIRTGSQNRVVLALGNGQFKSIEVKIGRSNEHDIEITDGLEVGDEVVISAQFLIDSESSKTSDFKRYEPVESIGQREVDSESPSIGIDSNLENQATVMGTINSIDVDGRQANISRGAIEKWQRGPATLDFAFSDEVDMTELHVGMHVKFTFEVGDEFVVLSIQEMKHD
jgi:membrane fusion protein, copper/silver efflux system